MIVVVVVALVVVEADPIEGREYQEFLMLLVETEGEEVGIGQVVEGMVVIREEQ